MAGPGAPTFEEFVQPLLQAGERNASPASLLSELPVGEFAVLDWLDEVQRRYGDSAEVEIIDRYDSVTLGDVYALFFPTSGHRSAS